MRSNLLLVSRSSMKIVSAGFKDIVYSYDEPKRKHIVVSERASCA